MSNFIELSVLGQMLRLNCPPEQHDALRQAARHLDSRVMRMKERTGILQMEKILSIVALNLSFELMQEQQKTQTIENVINQKIAQLEGSLEKFYSPKTSVSL